MEGWEYDGSDAWKEAFKKQQEAGRAWAKAHPTEAMYAKLNARDTSPKLMINQLAQDQKFAAQGPRLVEAIQKKMDMLPKFADTAMEAEYGFEQSADKIADSRNQLHNAIRNRANAAKELGRQNLSPELRALAEKKLWDQHDIVKALENHIQHFGDELRTYEPAAAAVKESVGKRLGDLMYRKLRALGHIKPLSIGAFVPPIDFEEGAKESKQRFDNPGEGS